jgi:hypothetical protein
MIGKTIPRLLTAFAGFALSAFAQIDWADLRTKCGPPLARETFTVMTEVEIVVDYAANGHVCRINLPPVAPIRDSLVSSPQSIDEFILELVPLTMRGKELNRMIFTSGPNNVSMIKYENVTVSEAVQARRRTGVTVTFTKEACRDQLAR